MTREVLVIGGGPAGIEAAVEAARAGAGVTLAVEGPIGGRAAHASLLPSKVLLRAAAARRRSGKTELVSEAEMSAAADAVAELSSRWGRRMERRLEDAGVRVLAGRATLKGAGLAEISSRGGAARALRWDACVLATGSVPRFPAGLLEGPLPDGDRVLAPRAVRNLRSLPRTISVVGGGATGSEMVSAFCSLGVEVTWLLDEYGILPGFARELSDSLGDVLMERGVKIVHGKRVVSLRASADGVVAKLDGGRSYANEKAFVAVGRAADVRELGLDSVGLSPSAEGAIEVDAKGATSVANVFAAGDITGAPYVASRGIAQGYAAGRSAAGAQVGDAAPCVVETVFTEPELAVVGLSWKAARDAGVEADVRTVQYSESLEGTLERVEEDKHTRGTLRVLLDVDQGTVLGASAIGPHAAELVNLAAIAIRCGARASDLSTLGLAHPTLGELFCMAMR